MAAANLVLCHAMREDAKLILIYDDVTLRGTGVQITAPPNLQKSCTAVVELEDGTVLTRQVNPNQFNTVFSIPNPRRPQGVPSTSQWGLPYIKWPVNRSALLF